LLVDPAREDLSGEKENGFFLQERSSEPEGRYSVRGQVVFWYFFTFLR
jgi:hypothetical protein